MKTKIKNKVLAMVVIGGLAVMTPNLSLAVTAPCTAINNSAVVDYSVNSVNQDDITSNTSSFNVGVDVSFAVAVSDTGNVSVTPGNTPAVLNFTVQNNGNATLRFNLSPVAAGNDTVSPFGGGNDSFDGNTVVARGEGGATPGYDSGNDSNTYLNLAPGGNDSAYIVYTPDDLSRSNNEVAVYYLVATAGYANGDSFDLSTSGNDSISAAQIPTCSDTTVDVVYGDTSGPYGSDAANDGKASDDSAYIVASATIGVTKGYTVLWDPINLFSSPKAIPGAIIQYSIGIENTGGSSAILTTITDALDTTNLTIDGAAAAASWAVTGGAVTRDPASGNLQPVGADGDGLVFSGGTLTATMATILAEDGAHGYAAGELKATETLTLTFKATVK